MDTQEIIVDANKYGEEKEGELDEEYKGWFKKKFS